LIKLLANDGKTQQPIANYIDGSLRTVHHWLPPKLPESGRDIRLTMTLNIRHG